MSAASIIELGMSGRAPVTGPTPMTTAGLATMFPRENSGT